MSISSAPIATASSTSRSLTSRGDCPDGKAVALGGKADAGGGERALALGVGGGGGAFGGVPGARRRGACWVRGALVLAAWGGGGDARLSKSQYETTLRSALERPLLVSHSPP